MDDGKIIPSLTAGPPFSRTGNSRTECDALITHTLTAHGSRMDFETETFVAHTLRGEGFDGSEDGTGRANLLPISFMAGQGAKAGSVAASTCLSPTLKSAPSGTNMVPSVALIPNIRGRSEVRRLTPKECERLQGFPDNYTLIPWRGKPAELCPDGPRYKALGNSMAVPVMRWLGERLIFVENIMATKAV